MTSPLWQWLAAHESPIQVVIEHSATLLAAGSLILLWLGLGRAVRKRLCGRNPLAGDDALLLIDISLGIGGLGTIILGMAFVGVLHAVPIVVVCATAAVLVRQDIVGMLRQCHTEVSRWSHAVWTAAVLLSALLIASALTPPVDWDSLMYHIRAPLILLSEGRLVTPEDSSLFISILGVAHFATLPLLALGLLEGPSLINVLLLPLIGVGTIALGKQITANANPYVTLAVLAGCPAMLLVAWSARVDIIFVLVLLALHLAVAAPRKTFTPASGWIIAILAGIAISTKSTALAYGVALIIPVLLAKPSPKLVGSMIAIVLLVAFPWVLKSWLYGSTPLYPLGDTGIEPWLRTRLEPTGVGILAENTAVHALWLSREPFSVFDAFFRPGRLTVEAEGAYYFLSPLILLAPLLLAVRDGRRGTISLLLAPVLFIAIIVVPFGRINLRYLLPVYPALAAACGAFVGTILMQLHHSAPRRLVLILCLLIASLPLVPMLQSRAPYTVHALRHLIGSAGGWRTWSNHPDPAARSLAPMVLHVADHTDSASTTLLLWEARALAFKYRVIADPVLSNWPLTSALPATEECWRNSGISHVLVNTASLRYYILRGAPPSAFQLPALERFRQECLGDPIFAAGGLALYRISPPASSPRLQLPR